MTSYGRRTCARIRSALALGLLTSTTFLASPASAAINVMSDPILYWNDIAITLATAFTPGGAPAQSRAYAMVNIAMHDAVNATRGYVDKSYLSGVANAGGDSRAAAAQAAHDVLVALNPANTAQYDTALTNSLALIGGGAAKTNGVATGAAYAAAILSNRTGDGANVIATYTAPTPAATNPGVYQFTPGVTAAVLPVWGNVKPFVLSGADLAGVDPGPPPALGSAEYTKAYNEVHDVVIALKGASLTPEQQDQKNSALFWDVSNGGTWIRAGLTIAEDENFDTLGFARVFATLSTTLVDTSIAIWDAKYDYKLWRPITAIQNGDFDGNTDTVGDATWTSLFAAPGHPSYVSAHSGYSAAASAVLASYFGDDEAFTFTISGDTRSFTSLAQARLDAANSRVWGGIHFRFDNEAGLKLGDAVAARALRINAFGAVPESSTWTMMIAGFACVGMGVRTRRRAMRLQRA